MAFVPGFEHDLFISYAHNDDRAWIKSFHDRLKRDLSRQLIGLDIWIDQETLGNSQDFRQEIPNSLERSAALISLVSPAYIDRPYCVQKECRRFVELGAARKQPGQRFASPVFATDLFGFRCPILPMPNSDYQKELIPGGSDISFCDDSKTFAIDSPSFNEPFDTLLRQLRELLRKMRYQSPSVLLFPRQPSGQLADAHGVLSRELNDRGYRLLPENELDPIAQVRNADLAVLLADTDHDKAETARRLVQEVTLLSRPLVVWPTPALERTDEPKTRAFLEYLRGLDYDKKNFLSSVIPAEKLKQEVLAALKRQAEVPVASAGKPRVYLVYDSQQASEAGHAGSIARHFRDEFYFEYSDNPRRHNPRLSESDGVLVIWGEADEEWCAGEFNMMLRLARQAKSRGLCLFDPKEPKMAIAGQIRAQHGAVHLTEQFGSFEGSRLEPFFADIRWARTGAM